MPTFLLVHGAWHGAWCWERLAPLLRERGHKVAAFDLPAHGEDRTSPYRATLGGYARRIRIVAEQLDEKPILVGHSMGGIGITQAAHDAPQLYAGLFYLCAFAPLPGDNLIGLARQDGGALTSRHTSIRPSGVRFAADGVQETFFGQCDEETVHSARAKLCPEPVLPILQRFKGREPTALPRSYLACTRDRAISVEHQRAMAERAGIERVESLDSDHSPFFSMPEELARRLEDLAG